MKSLCLRGTFTGDHSDTSLKTCYLCIQSLIKAFSWI